MIRIGIVDTMPLSKNILWRVRLFDGPKLESPEGETIARFKSQRVGALLAYLALKLGRPCPREELMYALWPEEDTTSLAANRLRVALASLRRQMEPPGIPFGSVLDVSHPGCIRLRSETVWCDVIAIEQALKTGSQEEAAYLLKGDLLPNYYEDWAIFLQQRFASLQESLEARTLAEEPLLPAEKGQHALSTPTFSSGARRYPLPLYLTTFYGREAERDRLLESFYENRLVTLIGSGGMGKTRLAVEVANQMRMPAVFVALADRDAAASVPAAILQALGVLPEAKGDLIEQVTGVLARQGSPLLILDNAEHLRETVATVTLQLLEALPDLQILVTSRQRLDILGEALFPLTALESPAPGLPYEVLIQAPAAALFLDRARRVRPDFTLAERSLADFVCICRQLEGVPLALELAAARVTHQTLSQIAEDLASNLLHLKSRQRGLSKRHQSLRATLQGSLDLLSEEQKAFFAALSVFQGGWTAKAARAVTGVEETEDFLEDLLARSLVVVREDPERGVIRYLFLEMVRQFAAELPSVEQRCSLTSRHCAYFLDLAAEAWEDDIRKFPPLDTENENLQLALETGWECQDAAFWNGLTGALCYMFVRGHRRMALPWIERVCAKASEITDAGIRTRLREVAIRHLQDLGWLDLARTLGHDMQADGRARGDLATETLAAIRLSLIETETEDCQRNLERSVAIQHEALQAAHSLNEPLLLKISLSMTARCLQQLGDYFGVDNEAGKTLLEEALALGQECYRMLAPYSRFRTTVEQNLQLCYASLGREEEAYTALKAYQKTALTQEVPSSLMFSFYLESLEAFKAGNYRYAALLQGASADIQERMAFKRIAFTEAMQALQNDLLQRLDRQSFEKLFHFGRRAPLHLLVAATIDNLPSLLREDSPTNP